MARQADLLSVEEARAHILERVRRLDAEDVPLAECQGRALSRAVHSTLQIPPFANSSMDGFAVRSADTGAAASTRPVQLTVVHHIAAGSGQAPAIQSGESARIMTGAPLPSGADAVAPFEDVSESEGQVSLRAPVRQGACVRPAGQDMVEGQEVLPAGAVLQSPQIGLLAALGRDRVSVTRKPRVAILSTGDELVEPGARLRPGQIYNSNSPMLSAAVAEAGGLPFTLPAARDDPAAIASALEHASGADLLLTSGGASVGDFDYVKQVVGAGGELSFWRVRVRPGKPLLFGTLAGIPTIGLPGNPTSALVTFELFVRPALQAMLGTALLRPELEAVFDDHFDNRGGRRTYARVRLEYRDGAFHARLAGKQDSAMLLPLASCDGLLVVPEDREQVTPGDRAVTQVWHLPARG